MHRWLFCAVAFIATVASAAVPSSQRAALIAFHDATGGPSWKNREGWLGAAGTECEWSGVECDGEQTTVIGLHLYDNGLDGRIPSAITGLPALQTLFVSDNRLPGPIPPELAQLANLESVFLQRVGLTGTIPPPFAALTKLRFVFLDGNELTGSIPREFGNAAPLLELGLSTNKLSGPVPPELGNLSNLVMLDLAYNDLTGTVPKELGRLAKLEFLMLADNELTGTIPPELGGLTSASVLRLDSNNLVGTIPNELTGLRNLEILALSDNDLTGKIAPDFGTMPALRMLILYLNKLEGPIPPELFRSTTLEELHLALNPLGGTIPREVGNATNLQVLSLHQTRLTGTIPKEIGSLTKLTSLELQVNSLEGTIPAEIGRLTALRWLDLASNKLTGPIPREVGALTNLEVFSVYENQLSGAIPAELGNLTKVRLFYLTSNRLTGTIPDSLRSLKAVEQFYVGGNLLEGGIPTWIGELTEVRDLSFAFGQFTGPIPPSIGALTNLDTLRLNHNLFSGAIPREIGNLKKLRDLSVSNNQLSGALPIELWSLEELITLSVQGNSLSGALPAAVSGLRNIAVLELHENDFEGPIPPQFGDLPNLLYLFLGENRLTGTIPKELGKLTKLKGLLLGYNALRGPIPSELRNLTSLEEGLFDVHFNALFAGDEATRIFINQRQHDHDYEATQTVTPANARIVSSTDRSVVIEWDAIRYSYHPGGYQVIARPAGGGAPVAIATTSSKDLTAITVRNLQPSTAYSFTIATVTHPHDYQSNLIVSDPTQPLQASTTARVLAPPEVALSEAPTGLVRIDGAAQNEDSFTLTNYGDTETRITFDTEGDFFTLEPATFSLPGGQSQIVVIRSVNKPAGTYYGYVVPRGAGVDDQLIVYLSMLSATRPPGTVVAEAVASRVEVSGTPGSDSVGLAQFRNTGTSTLTGIIQSDQPWVVPPNEPITIEPGQIAGVSFRIVRSRRPEGLGALTATLSLVYIQGTEQTADLRIGPHNNHTTGVSVTRVTVVDTTKPPVGAGSIPGVAGSEVALFAPGMASFLRAGKEFVSDVSILNASDAREISDLRLYFTPTASTQASVATLTSVASAQSVNLANVVGNVYGAQNAVGSLQVRSASWQNLSTFAKMVNVGSTGTFAGDVPVFRSDRSAIAGQQTYLTGFTPGAAQTDLYLQETSGGAVEARVEMLAANGTAVGDARTVSLGAFAMIELAAAVPPNVATVVITNLTGSAGRLAAYARVLYPTGDSSSIVDWSRYHRFARNEPMRVPFVVNAAAPSPPGRRRRSIHDDSVPLIGTPARTSLALFNPTSAEAVVKVLQYQASGGVTEREVEIAARQTATVAGAATHAVIEPLRGEIVVTARVESSAAGVGLGTAVPVVDAAAGLRLGQSRRFSNLDDSPSTSNGPGAVRTNIGLTETAGAPVTVRASMFLDDGKSLVSIVVSKDFAIPANGSVLTEDLVRSIIGASRDTAFGDLHGLQLQLEVVAGDGAVVAFVIVNDKGSGDALLRLE